MAVKMMNVIFSIEIFIEQWVGPGGDAIRTYCLYISWIIVVNLAEA